jgi:hypothetical protein
MNRIIVEVKDINIHHSEKYDMFIYNIVQYKDTYFKPEGVMGMKRIVSFNKPIDLRIGEKYIVSNLDWNDRYNNYVFTEDSRIMGIMKTDLFQYM